MLSLLLALTASLPTTVPTIFAPPSVTTRQTAVRIRLNGGDYWPGDRVKVEVETAEDGYLVVFRVDADGLIRVLFPLDPDLDAFVRGGKKYELRGRGDRETFLADDQGGTGLIYAALSREPMDLRRYAEGSHWDYVELKLQSDDPEAELSWFMRQFTSNGEFEYDVMGYRVHGPGGADVTPVVVTGGGGYYDPYYGSSYGYGYPRTGVNISIGAQFGHYYPYYDPFYYDPWYGYGYGYGYGGYGYRYGGFGYGYSPYRHITVFPTRPHGVVSNPLYGVRSRPRAPLAGVGSFADGAGGVSTIAGGGRNSGGTRNIGGGGGSRGEVTTSRPRAPQGEAQRPRSGTQAQSPRSGEASTGSVGRSAPAPTARPATTSQPPADRGGRSRRPTESATQAQEPNRPTARRIDERTLAPAATDRPAAATRIGSGSTARPAPSSTDGDRPAARPSSERRAADRPVYRPPTAAPSESGSNETGSSVDRPAAASRPRHVDRPAPSTGRSTERPAASPRSEPQDRSARPSVDRSSGGGDRGGRSAPAVRSAPSTRSAPAARSAPSGRSEPAARSAPSSSRGSSGSSGRSRGSSN